MEDYLIEKLIPKLKVISSVSDKAKLFLKFISKVILDFK